MRGAITTTTTVNHLTSSLRGALVHTGGITLVTRDVDLWSFSFSEKLANPSLA
ncbi:hypothetical protein YC2023_051262 [Brassica napus]